MSEPQSKCSPLLRSEIPRAVLKRKAKYIPPFLEVGQICGPQPHSLLLGQFAVAGNSRVIDPDRVRKKNASGRRAQSGVVPE
jgi:hypothetical protein